jgi:hypothetical protein
MKSPSRRSIRSTGLALVTSILVVGTFLGGVASAATTSTSRTYSATLAPACVKVGSTVSFTLTITNTSTTSSVLLGSARLVSNIRTGFTGIKASSMAVTSTPTGKTWTVTDDKNWDGGDFDAVYLTAAGSGATGTANSLTPGQSVTVTFSAKAPAASSNQSWSVAATTGVNQSGTAFSPNPSVVTKVAASCASSIGFVSGPTSTQAGHNMANVTVKVYDGASQTGNGVAGETVKLTSVGLATNNPTAVTDSTGVATFTGAQLKVGNTAGTGISMTASDGTLTANATFNISAGTVSSVTFTTPPASTQAGGAMANAVVQVTDGLNPVNAAAVTLSSSCIQGGSAGPQTTDASGNVTFSGLQAVAQANASCSMTATATDPFDQSQHTSAPATFAVTHGAAASIAFTTAPKDTPAGSAMAPIVVKVTDGPNSTGNPVDGDQVTLTSSCLNQSPSTQVATVTDGTATFTNGTASVDLTVKTLTQDCTMTATEAAQSLSTPAASFKITPGSDTSQYYIKIGQQPGNTLINTTMTPAVTVQEFDQFNNPVTTDNSSGITLSLAGGDPAATLSGGTATVSGGVATFPNIKVDKSASNYTLTATLDGSSPAITATTALFDITNIQDPNLTCTTPGDPACTLPLPGGGTVNVAAGGTAPIVIIEPPGQNFGCDSVPNPVRTGAPTITIEPQSGSPVTITMDTPKVPVVAGQGFYPICKSVDATGGPIAMNLHLCSQSPGFQPGVGCVNEQDLQFPNETSGNNLHTVFTIDSTDPHAKGP